MGGQVMVAGRRADVQLVRGPEGWTINGDDDVKLGFTWADAAKQRAIFTTQLLAIGNRINALQDEKGEDWQKTIAEAVKALPGDTDAFIESLSDVLTLQPASAELPKGIQPQMKLMRDSGLALWNQLDDDLKTKLKEDYGVLDSDPTQEDKQAQLWVQLPQLENGLAAPICWNMIYQEDEDKPRDPLQFWGFRVAISQWPKQPRNNLIKIRPALTASDGMLPFACYEASLAKAFAGEANCVALERELLTAVGATPPDESASLGEQTWLGEFLRKQDSAYEQNAAMPEWLEDQVTAVFKQPYGLIHFSCHCEPDPNAEPDPTGQRNPPERRLQLSLAGGGIHLNQNFVINRLKLNKDGKLDRNDPGGLVFLNACGTGQQVSGQFPDLPFTWIRFRGAKAVVATLCEVPDIFAYAFALKLYQFLGQAQEEYLRRVRKSRESEGGLAPQPPQLLYLDAALLATRRFFMQRFNNPLGLAYELYAYQGARLEPPLEGGHP